MKPISRWMEFMLALMIVYSGCNTNPKEPPLGERLEGKLFLSVEGLEEDIGWGEAGYHYVHFSANWVCFNQEDAISNYQFRVDADGQIKLRSPYEDEFLWGRFFADKHELLVGDTRYRLASNKERTESITKGWVTISHPEE